MSPVDVGRDDISHGILAIEQDIVRNDPERFASQAAITPIDEHGVAGYAHVVRNRQVRAEVSQCQRWVEIRIGEWLGPAKIGRPEKGSCDEPSSEIHKAHKHEFRFLAEHKAIVTDIMKGNPGKEITRAWLIGAIEDALLVNHGAREGQGVGSGSSHCVPPGASRSVNLRF
jgi:hypothetical protein